MLSYVSEYKIKFKPKPARLELIDKLIGIASNQYNSYETLLKSKCDGLTSSDLLLSYKNECPHIRKTDTREARYGEYYEMVIHKKIGKINLMKCVREFIFEVTYGFNDLPYVVLSTVVDSKYFIRIWIADRKWDKEVKRYKRDFWYDKDTGKPALEHARNAIKKCTKGDPVLDSKGNVIILCWKSRKTKIFNENYKTTQPRNYDVLEAILIRIKNTIYNKLSFWTKKNKTKRVVINSNGNRHKDNLYREVASLQYYIQQQCYRYILDNFNYESWQRDMLIGMVTGEPDIKRPYGELSRKVVNLFYKYRSRINKGSFKTKGGIKYALFKGVSYFDGLANAQLLRNEFKSELNQLMGGNANA